MTMVIFGQERIATRSVADYLGKPHEPDDFLNRGVRLLPAGQLPP